VTAPGGVIATVYVNVLPAVQGFSQQLRQQLRASSRQLRSLDRELVPVTNALRTIGQVATGIVPGIQLTTSSLKAMGAHAIVGGLLSTAGAMTTLSGALLTLPAVGVAAASVMGTLAVGLFGVQDALKEFTDVDKFNEKLGELSGNAQATLGVLNEFRGEIDSFRDSVQDRLFAGLDDVGQGLIETFLPRLTTHFGNLADAINAGAKDLAAFAQTGETLRDVDETSTNVETAFVELRKALIPAATALRDVVTVGSRFLPLIAFEVTKVVQRFAEWIAHLRETGQLQEFIARGLEALRQVGRILGNVGRALGGILGAAQDSGNGLLDTIERLTDSVADFINSTRGQIAIRSFLDSARGAAEALAPVLVALVDLFFNHVFPVFEAFAVRVGPAVAQFFTALGDALDVAAPGISAFAVGFGQFIQAIIPVLPLIGQLINQLGVLIGVVAAKLGPVIADVATAIGNLLLPALEALTAIFMFISPELLKFVVIIGVVIAAVAGLLTVIRGFQAVAAIFAGGLELMAGGAAKTQGAMGKFVGFLGGPWGVAIGLATIALGLFLSTTDETATNVNSLSEAMINATDSADKASDAWIRQKLEQDGVADTAGKFGITLKELTDAYKGIPEAQEAVTRKYRDNADTANANREETLKLLDALLNGEDVYNGAKEAVDRKNQADRDSVSVLGTLNNLLDAQRAALALVRDEIDKQQSAQLAALNSELAYRTQLDQTTSALAANTMTLDINTTEGQANLKTLSALALAGQRRVQDLLSEGKTTAEVNAVLQANHDQLIGLLTPYFDSAEAAKAFALEVGLIPREPISIKASFDSGGAIGAIQALIANLNNLKGTFALINKIPFIGGPLAQLGLAASANARGGPVAAGEWSWVGEEGPELVRFGRAARVFSADESARMSRDVGELDVLTTRGGSGGTSGARVTTSASDTVTVDNHVTVEPTVRIYLDGRVVEGIVERVVTEHDRRVVRLVTGGTGRR
jgi:hypothetical protein